MKLETLWMNKSQAVTLQSRSIAKLWMK